MRKIKSGGIKIWQWLKRKLIIFRKWDLFINAGTRPYYLADVTHNEKTYQVKSMFYPSGEYVGFDPGSEPDKNGYYTEQGFYDSAE